jgi:hypothetical protein
LELQSIVDYGTFNPAIDPAFDPTAVDFYWLSTSYVANPTIAWLVNFNNGGVAVDDKSTPLWARAVRGDRCRP